MFILRETFRFLRHHFGSWLMTCLTLGVALGVSGLFAMLAWRAHSTMAELRSNLALEAFFDPGIPSGDAARIAQEKIEPLPGISRITFVSKEQALSDYTTSSGEDVESVLGMNPLPASVKVYMKEPSAASAKSVETSLRTVRGVEDVRGNFPLLHTEESRSHSLDTIAILFSSLLLLSAFFYSLLAARHSLGISRETLRALGLLGATRFASIAPIVMASSLAGILGGALGWALAWGARTQALHFFNASLTTPITTQELLLWLGILVLSGWVIGTLGATAATLTGSHKS